MNELDVLRDVSQRLTEAGFAYMLTGSIAMSYYAEPRMTRDIDLVVELRDEDAVPISHLFQSGYYVSVDAVREAIRDQSIFNLIHEESLTKIDLVIRKDTDYRRVEFARRRECRLAGVATFVVSKEDLIISKIEWARDSRSEIQMRDVRNLSASGYDRAYVDRWTSELGLSELAEDWLS